MPLVQQNRTPAVSDSGSTQAESLVADTARAVAADQQQDPISALSEALVPGSKDAIEASIAQATVRSLDDGSFKGISSADNVAALELARRKSEDISSRNLRAQQATFPKKAVEGYTPSELLQQLLGEVLFATRTRLLGQRRTVAVRGAKDSLNWLSKGLNTLSELVASTLLGGRDEKGNAASAGRSGLESNGIPLGGAELERLLAQAEQQVSHDVSQYRQEDRLSLEDSEADGKMKF